MSTHTEISPPACSLHPSQKLMARQVKSILGFFVFKKDTMFIRTCLKLVLNIYKAHQLVTKFLRKRDVIVL